MRPPIDGWFDSTIRVWRPTTTKDAVGVEQPTYTIVDTYGAAVNRSKTVTGLQGGGMTRVGTLRWYGKPTIDVRPRDVCEILTGPDRGRTWEVNARPVRPRNHHTQVDCIKWHGTLPSTG